MAIPTMDEVKATLEPYHHDIRRVIAEAWAEWRQVETLRADQGYGTIAYNRTIANFIFDGIARRAIPHFGALNTVRVEIESQTFKLYVKDLLIRFKKGGQDRLGQNIPTFAALLFEDAEGQLPGFPPHTCKIEIIWLPNEIWTDVDRVLIVARDGDYLIWEYDIERASGTGGVVIPFPSAPDRGPPPDAGDLVKPKAKPVDKPKKQ
jgi:hypothetical protein